MDIVLKRAYKFFYLISNNLPNSAPRSGIRSRQGREQYCTSSSQGAYIIDTNEIEAKAGYDRKE